MNTFLYDSTFEGFLTLVYESCVLQITPDRILDRDVYQQTLFGQLYSIKTDTEKADQLWDEVKKRSPQKVREMLYRVHLSAAGETTMLLYRFMRILLRRPKEINNVQNDIVMEIRNIDKRVRLEASRMIQFVRFQRTADNIYFSGMSPEYNVLPLVINFFKNRYADQKWILYDMQRDYGFYYDLREVTEIKLRSDMYNKETGEISDRVMSEDEKLLQAMWAGYYKAVNIKERKNLKLHIQSLPKKYWKYIPEKRNIR